MPGKSFVTKRHHWAINPKRFWEAKAQFLSTVSQEGVYASDNLITWAKNLGFLDDEAFINAWNKHTQDDPLARGILWRTAILVWAAKMALRPPAGDFAEFGCYAGASVRIVMDVVPIGDRHFWLYDLFDTPPGVHSMPEHGPGLYDRVVARFPEPNVHIVRGLVPDSFSQGIPDKIAYAHIDMNSANAELATLDTIEPRLVPGAVIILDDYGHLTYREQHERETPWFVKRGVPLLELPTGQALAIWP